MQRGFANAGGGGSQSAAHAATSPSFDAATISPRWLQRHAASTSTDNSILEGGVRRVSFELGSHLRRFVNLSMVFLCVM